MLKPLNIIAALCCAFFILPLAAKDKKQVKPVTVKVAPQKIPTKKAARNWLNRQLKFLQETTDDIRKLPDKASDKKYVKTFLDRYDPDSEKSVYNKLIPKVYIPIGDYIPQKKEKLQELDTAKLLLRQTLREIPSKITDDPQLNKVIDSIQKNIVYKNGYFPWEESYFHERYYIIKKEADISDDDDPDLYEFKLSHPDGKTKTYIIRGKKRGSRAMAEEWVENELRLMQCTVEKLRDIRDIMDLKDHVKPLLSLYGIQNFRCAKPYIYPALEGEYIKAQQKYAAELKETRAELSEELTRMKELEFHKGNFNSALLFIGDIWIRFYDHADVHASGPYMDDDTEEIDLSWVKFHADEATIDEWIRKKIRRDREIITTLKRVQTPEQTREATGRLMVNSVICFNWLPTVCEIPTWDDYDKVAKKYEKELNATKTELQQELERVKKLDTKDSDFHALVAYLCRYHEHYEKLSASFDAEKYLEQETARLQQIADTLKSITNQESLDKNYENLLDLCGLKNHRIPDSPPFIPIGDKFANAAKIYNRRINRLMNCYYNEEERIGELAKEKTISADHDIMTVLHSYLDTYIHIFTSNAMFYQIESGDLEDL